MYVHPSVRPSACPLSRYPSWMERHTDMNVNGSSEIHPFLTVTKERNYGRIQIRICVCSPYTCCNVINHIQFAPIQSRCVILVTKNLHPPHVQLEITGRGYQGMLHCHPMSWKSIQILAGKRWTSIINWLGLFPARRQFLERRSWLPCLVCRVLCGMSRLAELSGFVNRTFVTIMTRTWRCESKGSPVFCLHLANRVSYL